MTTFMITQIYSPSARAHFVRALNVEHALELAEKKLNISRVALEATPLRKAW